LSCSLSGGASGLSRSSDRWVECCHWRTADFGQKQTFEYPRLCGCSRILRNRLHPDRDGVGRSSDARTSRAGAALGLHARYYIDFNGAAETVMRAVPLAGGAVLLLLALRPWRELLPQRAVAQAA